MMSTNRMHQIMVFILKGVEPPLANEEEREFYRDAKAQMEKDMKDGFITEIPTEI